MTEGAFHEYRERAGACPDCGNSPVNHFESYCSHTLSVWISAFSGSGVSPVARASRFLARIVEPFIFRSLAALPMTAFSRDPSRAVTYRSQVVWEEAARRGIDMEQVIFFGKPTELYRARLDGAWRYFQSLPLFSSVDAAVDWVDDKFRLKVELARAGIPAPRALSVASESAAQRALDTIGTPVVVKPREGSRGRHTTVNVRTRAQMTEAFRSAQQLCRYVVIERYLSGSVCRGTVVGGTLSGFFQAQPPKVVGDGTSTVRALIAQQNASKPERVGDIVLSSEHERFLARLGYTADSVLPLGTVVSLTHRTGRLFGGRTRELLGSEHKKLRAYLERAAKLLGSPVVGFDLIIPDPEQDPDLQEWGIIEANSLPYIDLHYLPLEGEPSIVARDVWDFVEAHPELL